MRKGGRFASTDDRYLHYVPIRRAWTMCVEEGLPPDAAVYCLNQTHLFPDFIFVIDAQEKRMFEAIHGHRSISEILDKVEEKGAPPAALFREALVVRPGGI